MKRLTLAALALLSASPQCVLAQDGGFDADWKLKPALLNSSATDEIAPALKYSVDARYDYSPWGRRESGFARVLSEGSLTTRSKANTDVLFAEAHLGAALQLMEESVVQEPPRPGETPSTEPAKLGRRFGRLELSGKVRFETDQLFDNSAVTVGPQIGYFHNNYRGLWPLVPSVYADYQRVEPVSSDYLDEIGADDGGFYRASAVASWDMPLGEMLASNDAALAPLGAIFNARYYESMDVPDEVEKAGRDTSWYVEAGLNYELSNLGARWIRNVFVTVARGRVPPSTENATMVFVGLVLGSDRPDRAQ